ncbi:MAG: polysaccharide biosynthesis C-terminal domain-containing protein, partial [Acidobacteriota bacterium]|nr:polysaccharide biosynthesis C-terminal domain-containing protein [Acidobacteriota bacterium]
MSATDQSHRSRLSVNTAIFAAATALSRVVGLAREAFAGAFFGTSRTFSAFAIASQIPNLMANLFAQAALSAAFVPVFTDLLQKGRKEEAFRLATTLFWIVMLVLGVITALGILLAGPVLTIFGGTNFAAGAAATMTQIMFPVVLLLGLSGVLTGVLQSYDEFSIPALAPVVWNVVIIVLTIVLRHHTGGGGVYGYAIAWLIATAVQLLLIASALRRIDYRLSLEIDWHDPRIRQVFMLMLPVTIGLGIINVDALINSSMGALVATHPRPGEGPAAI